LDDERDRHVRVIMPAVTLIGMVEISLTDDHLYLEIKGLDKLWAFKSQLILIVLAAYYLVKLI